MKVNNHEIDNIRQLVETLPTVDDITHQREFLESSIKQFHSDNAQFHLDFQKQNEIIRRYDEVLNQKGSKIAL